MYVTLFLDGLASALKRISSDRMKSWAALIDLKAMIGARRFMALGARVGTPTKYLKLKGLPSGMRQEIYPSPLFGVVTTLYTIIV